MTTDELKNLISQNTGIPAEMLTGETPEENITRARQLLAFKRDNSTQAAEDPGELFANWIRSQTGELEKVKTPEAALNEIAEQVRIDNGGYPIIPDGGASNITGFTGQDARPTEEIFKEWFYNASAFDPFSNDGWTQL